MPTRDILPCLVGIAPWNSWVVINPRITFQWSGGAFILCPIKTPDILCHFGQWQNLQLKVKCPTLSCPLQPTIKEAEADEAMPKVVFEAIKWHMAKRNTVSQFLSVEACGAASCLQMPPPQIIRSNP